MAYTPPPPPPPGYPQAPPHVVGVPSQQPAYPFAPVPAAPPQPHHSNRTIVIVVVAVVVLLLVIGVAALAYDGSHPNSTANQSSPPPPPPPASQTIVSAGTVWNLNAGQYEYEGPLSLTGTTSWALTGQFTASHGVTAYAMTSSEYSAWGGSSSAPSSYYWTTGPNVASGSVNVNLPAGTYYLVWVNPNSFTATSVDITSDVVATQSSS